MANPFIRHIGIVEDLDEVPCDVGVDYDSVQVGGYRFSRDQAEAFGRLFVAACWEAGINAERERARSEAEVDG